MSDFLGPVPHPLPTVSNAFIPDLVNHAKDWAHVNGLGMRSKNEATSSDSTLIAPFTLFPSPFPRKLFDFAASLQKDMNFLYYLVGNDFDFILRSLADTVRADSFTRQHIEIWNEVRKEGEHQPTFLNLQRTDYMMQPFERAAKFTPSLRQWNADMIPPQHFIRQVTEDYFHFIIFFLQQIFLFFFFSKFI